MFFCMLSLTYNNNIRVVEVMCVSILTEATFHYKTHTLVSKINCTIF